MGIAISVEQSTIPVETPQNLDNPHSSSSSSIVCQQPVTEACSEKIAPSEEPPKVETNSEKHDQPINPQIVLQSESPHIPSSEPESDEKSSNMEESAPGVHNSNLNASETKTTENSESKELNHPANNQNTTSIEEKTSSPDDKSCETASSTDCTKPFDNSESDSKIDNTSTIGLPPTLKRCLGLFPSLGEEKCDSLFVISENNILGYVGSLEAAKLWIEEEISRKMKIGFPLIFETERNEYIFKDNLVYTVTVYEKNINSLMSRSTIFLQYNVWQISRLYSEEY